MTRRRVTAAASEPLLSVRQCSPTPPQHAVPCCRRRNCRGHRRVATLAVATIAMPPPVTTPLALATLAAVTVVARSHRRPHRPCCRLVARFARPIILAVAAAIASPTSPTSSPALSLRGRCRASAAAAALPLLSRCRRPTASPPLPRSCCATLAPPSQSRRRRRTAAIVPRRHRAATSRHRFAAVPPWS